MVSFLSFFFVSLILEFIPPLFPSFISFIPACLYVITHCRRGRFSARGEVLVQPVVACGRALISLPLRFSTSRSESERQRWVRWKHRTSFGVIVLQKSIRSVEGHWMKYLPIGVFSLFFPSPLANIDLVSFFPPCLALWKLPPGITFLFSLSLQLEEAITNSPFEKIDHYLLRLTAYCQADMREEAQVGFLLSLSTLLFFSSLQSLS